MRGFESHWSPQIYIEWSTEMGLDMYLNVTRYLSEYNEADKQKKEELFKLFPELKAYANSTAQDIMAVKVHVGYWRNAYAIHNWFTEKTRKNEDDCTKYYVYPEHLMKLKSLCEQVLADNSLAQKLLPVNKNLPDSHIPDDEYYFDYLRNTVEIIDPVLTFERLWSQHLCGAWIEYHYDR